jgi:hypothetical protein
MQKVPDEGMASAPHAHKKIGKRTVSRRKVEGSCQFVW